VGGLPRWLVSCVLSAAVVVVGSAAALAGDASTSDWIVGLTIGVAGGFTLPRRLRDATGWLLLVAAALWFAGTLSNELLFAHRGPLLVVILVPVWMASMGWASRPWTLALLAVAAASVAVSFGAPASSTVLLGATGMTALGLAIGGRVRGVGAPWTAMWLASIPASALWLVFATSTRWWSSLDTGIRLHGYEIAVTMVALATAASRVRHSATVAEASDVHRAQAVGDVLGDRTMVLGFETGDGTYRAADGSLVVAQTSQVSTELDLGEEGRALLVHRPGVLDDDRVRADVVTAARLLAVQNGLTNALRLRAAEVNASRFRLVVAEDRAADAFECDLDRRVLPHLDTVLALFSQRPGQMTEPYELARSLKQELAQFSTGATPAALRDGLGPALAALVRDAPIVTELDIADADFDEATTRTLYFVAAEAIANAVKHSAATRIVVRLVGQPGVVEMSVVDDGNGGATVGRRGGLAGLVDRVESLGGTLELESRPGIGTSVNVRLDGRSAVNRFAPTTGS
jgi:two-component sensor histidine kinase